MSVEKSDFDRLLESGDEQAITAMIDTKQAAQNEAKANMEYLLNVGMHDHAQNEKARYDLLGRQIDRLLAALQRLAEDADKKALQDYASRILFG